MKPPITLSTFLTGTFFIFTSIIQAQSTIEPEPMKMNSLAYDPYKNYPVYTGDDLGLKYSATETILKVWSPPAEEMKIKLYRTSLGNDLVDELSCRKDTNGVWTAELKGDRKNLYYAFLAKINGKWNEENPDPYAKRPPL